MVNKRLIYYDDWIDGFLTNNSLSLDNDVINEAFTTTYIPTEWNLEASFKKFYSGTSDIRELLADCASATKASSTDSMPQMTLEEAKHVLLLVKDTIKGCDWSSDLEPLSSSLDPANPLLRLGECYFDVSKQLDLGSNSGIDAPYATFALQCGFHLNESDSVNKKYYEDQYLGILEEIKQKNRPAYYLDMIIKRMDFYFRFDSSLDPQFRYILLGCSMPSSAKAEIEVLRLELKYLSCKYAKINAVSAANTHSK